MIYIFTTFAVGEYESMNKKELLSVIARLEKVILKISLSNKKAFKVS